MITVTVPAGATSGRITVVTPGSKGKSNTDFTATTRGLTLEPCGQ